MPKAQTLTAALQASQRRSIARPGPCGAIEDIGVACVALIRGQWFA